MKLRDWRKSKGYSLREGAEQFGIGAGANPARRMQRVETGESPVDALLANTIVEMTEGEVTLQDLNDTRRDWLAGARSSIEVVE